MPTVSVVVPCRNEARRIESLLDALCAQDYRDFEVIVVDGRSTDGTRDIVRREAESRPGLNLRLLDNPRGNIPSALNFGIQQARGEIIARIDTHSRPAPHYLSRCLAVLDESGADVVGGAWDIKPGAPGVVAEAIAVAVSSPLGAGDALYRRKSTSRPQDTDTVPFGCFHRSTWEALGGYDESLLTNEDYDFNWRVRQRWGRVRFDPSIRCEYFARPTLRALFRQYWRYGWWKGRMLRQHPRSIRVRQVVPMLWAACNGLLFALSLFWPLARLALAVFWLTYSLVVVGYAGRLAARQRWALWPILILAFGIIHLVWGGAACAGLVIYDGYSRITASRLPETAIEKRRLP